MQKNGQLRRIFRLSSAIVNWTLLTSLYAYVWYSYYSLEVQTVFFRRGHWLVIALYAFMLLIFTKIYGGYKVGDLRIAEMVYSHSFAIAIVNGITYLQISLLSLALADPTELLLLSFAQLVVVIIWAVLSNRLFYDIFPPREVLMVYGSDSADSVRYKLSQRSDKYNLKEEISVEDGLEAVFDKILGYSAVVLCDVQSPYRNDILKLCFDHSIRTYITPKISDIILRGAEPIQLFDTMLMLNRNAGLTYEQRAIKRIVDVAASGLALLILSPIYLVTAIAIKLEDGGPIIYKQQRLTRDGKVFELRKFRSMIVDAEHDGVARLSSVGDDRVTRVGRFIRAVRIDELPQLVNILCGDMSLVGPRPERPEIAAEYCKEMPEFSYRLKLKAGLTGYAQVVGRYNTSAYDKLKLDLMYIQSYSLLMDIRIILMTIKILFMKESTQGIDKDATNAKSSRQEQKLS